MHTAPTWVFGPFDFDAGTFRLRRDGHVVPLEPKAIDLLRLLLERSPAVVEKAEIFDIIWHDVAVTDNALTRVIAHLRRALDDDARSPRYIETVATRGYRFIAELRPTVEDLSPVVERESQNDIPAADIRDLPATPARERRRFPGMNPLVALATGAMVVGGFLLGSPVTRALRERLVPAASLADGRAPLEKVAAVRPAQVTTGSGLEAQAAFSSDGTTLAFSSDRSGSFEIYVQSLTPGAAPMALTTNRHANIQPAWSPDGRFIAYHDAAGGGIWVVPSRGGTARQLAATGSRPTWSPDGQLIAYQTLVSNLLPTASVPSGASSIWVVEPATGRARAVTQAGSMDRPHVVPQWSPSSRRLFFFEAAASTWNGESTLWSVDVATGERRIEARGKMIVPDYALAPDGSGAWILTRTGMVWWLPLTGDVRTREAQPTGLPSPGAQADLALSPDGRTLAWTLVQLRTGLQWVALPGAHGRAASPEVVPLGNGVRATGAVAAPDGRLAYSGVLQGSAPQIWLREVDGAVRQITLDGGEHGNPSWLSGSREVAFFAGHDGVSSYNALDVATGNERELFRLSALPLPSGATLHPMAYLNVAVDRTASRALFALTSDGVTNLWVSDIGSTGLSFPRQLTREPQSGAFPKWSPDGRWISYQCDVGANTHVCVVGADGTGRRQLTTDSGLNFTGGWIGSDTILVAARRDAVWNVVGVDRVSGTMTTYTAFTDAHSYVRYPQWDEVNRRITFERSETTGNLWMAELP